MAFILARQAFEEAIPIFEGLYMAPMRDRFKHAFQIPSAGTNAANYQVQ